MLSQTIVKKFMVLNLTSIRFWKYSVVSESPVTTAWNVLTLHRRQPPDMKGSCILNNEFWTVNKGMFANVGVRHRLTTLHCKMLHVMKLYNGLGIGDCFQQDRQHQRT
jgi:hypothetical protein